MNHKKQFILSITIFIFVLFLWHTIDAQDRLNTSIEDSTTSTITNEERILKEDSLIESNDTIIRTTQDSVLKEESVADSIETITRTTADFEQEKQTVIDEIKSSLKEDIDDSIIQIRRETSVQAYELQRVVDVERKELFENITRTIESTIAVDESNAIDELRQFIDRSIRTIQANLQNEAPQVPVSFDRSLRNINQRLQQFEQKIKQNRIIIESRQGVLVFLDSDGDGLSDYDEIYIYGTDPYNAYTIPGDLNDGEKVARGINPLSPNMEPIEFQNPREDRDSFVSASYTVEKVQLIKEDNRRTLVFEGRALPNTFVTLYIFSTPIIVTVKTDLAGRWTYELEKELETGEHQVYVATVDSSGKIVARSNPVLFTKTAEAAVIGIAGSVESAVTTQNFVKDNFVLITLAILIAIVILSMMFVGNHKNIKSAVSELRQEVNSK